MPIGRRRFIQGAVLGLTVALLAGCRYLPGRPPPGGPPPGGPPPGGPPPDGPPPGGPPPDGRPTEKPQAAVVQTAAASEAVSWPGFDAFPDDVRTRADSRYLLVESDGLPDHPMMIGIRSWQQQVPLPQPYTGENAWRIPLHAALADQPTSALTGLYKGAIALAANGVPIFNALNNRGDDAYLVGELDQWGGHSGRADDYHYHIAPLHLQATLGPGSPIGYALDGYPLYGLTEPDGSTARPLDDLNGHDDPADGYHYHATPTYPYINGGLRGVVTVRDDQLEPQPRTTPIRPSLTPLRGAIVTGFSTLGPDSYALEYQLAGQTHTVKYRREGSAYLFDFVDPAGRIRSESFPVR